MSGSTDPNTLTLIYQGKVANVYKLGEKHLLLSRTNQISGLNAKMLSTMPYKGEVLSQLSQWWMNKLGNICPNHLIKQEISELEQIQIPSNIVHSSTVVKKLKPIAIEAIVRRHVTGSSLKSYQKTGKICGITLPDGLEDGDRLDDLIFTPTEKSETDDAISFAEMQRKVGAKTARTIRALSIKIFETAEEILLKKGIILVDSKFEFGYDENEKITLMDEVLTPDSSRFWDAVSYYNEREIISYDKQKIRDWLAQAKNSGKWDGESSIELPPELIAEVSEDYVKIFENITGFSPQLS